MLRERRDTGKKTALLGLCYDPDTTSRDYWERTPNVWPDVEFPDICAYLIHTPSPYTKEALKSYKSTEVWSYFCAGYVQDVSLLKFLLLSAFCLQRYVLAHSRICLY